ncbi:hypothetical protein A4A49_60413, partial [Nicotiana attenuata]
YANIIANCRYLLDQLHGVTMAHTYREGNEVTDGLAKVGCNFPSTDKPLIFEEPTDFVNTFLQRDQAGATRTRKTTGLMQHQLEDVDQHIFDTHSIDLRMATSNSPIVMDNYNSIASTSISISRLSNNYNTDAGASSSP